MLQLIKNEPRVSSFIIAKNTNNAYESIRDLIKKYENKLTLFGEILTADLKSVVGKEAKKVTLLNEQQAYLLITFMRNSKIVIDFKVKLVDEFFKIREFIHNQTLNEKVVNLNESK